MPIAPKPYKLKCQKCGYSKIVKLKSDCLSVEDVIKMSTTCPKCNSKMDRVEMSFLEKALNRLLL